MLAVLADGQATVREAIARIIHETHNMEVLQANDVGDAVKLCRDRCPSLVLLEIMMSGMDSFSGALEIRKSWPTAKIAILTSHRYPDQLAHARRQHLNGFILKHDRPEELFYAIRTILGGGFYMPPSMSTGHMNQNDHVDPMASLTQRERAVLTLYAQGLSIKEIASELDVTVKTAETHRNNFGRKLGHPNRSQVTAFALKNHLIDEELLAFAPCI